MLFRSVGQRGARVQNVVNELDGENIDIVQYEEDPSDFIANALNPAEVIAVQFGNDDDEDEKNALVIVPDYQLSLAIGKKGQNVRLAARLTGYKIDIRPESEVEFVDENKDDSDKKETDDSATTDETDADNEDAEETAADDDSNVEATDDEAADSDDTQEDDSNDSSDNSDAETTDESDNSDDDQEDDNDDSSEDEDSDTDKE